MRLKGIERWPKKLVIRMMAAVLRPPRRGKRPDWSARPHRVLYLRYDKIGDMILASGIIQAIARSHGTLTVDVLASSANAGVLRNNPYVGEVLTFDKKRPWSWAATIAQIRRGRYDAVLDAMVLSPSLTTVLLMWASGARHRIGVADRGNEFALTIAVPRARRAVHYVDHSAALLAAFGVDPQPAPSMDVGALDAPLGGWGIWRPRLYLTDDERTEGEQQWTALAGGSGGGRPRPWRLVVNVSAGNHSRYWPEDRFIAVLTRVGGRFPDVRALIVGSPRDAERMQRIGQGAGVPLAHTPGLRQMMALVAAADLVFTADTSVTHVASAFEKPALVMFPRGRGALYGPYGTDGRVVSTPAPTLWSLPVAPVAAALERLIAGVTRQPHAALVEGVRAHGHELGLGDSGAEARA